MRGINYFFCVAGSALPLGLEINIIVPTDPTLPAVQDSSAASVSSDSDSEAASVQSFISTSPPA